MRRSFIGLAVATIAILTPFWALAGDKETAQQIADNLHSSGRLKGYSIGVKVNEGTVWVNGTVKSQQQLSAALDIIQQTPGIEKIINGIAIADASAAPAAAAPMGAPPTDSPGRYAAAMHPAIGAAIQQTSAESNEGGAQLAATAAPYDQVEAAPAAPSSVSSGRGSGAPRPLMPSHLASQSQPMPVPVQAGGPAMGMQMAPNGAPIPAYAPGVGGGVAPAHFDRPNMPGYAWPSYAAYPNYAALTYPKQYSPTAWPFIGPFYPYPQVPLGWRKVSLEWHNGWWMLDFKDSCNDTY
jgi:hypothetical protein